MMNDTVTTIKEKSIKDYQNYLIYSDGRVFSLKTKKFLKQSPTKQGELKVNLSKDGKSKVFHIKQLLAEAFVSDSGATNQQKQPDSHNQNIKNDNQAENLAATAKIENSTRLLMQKIIYLATFIDERQAWVAENILEIAKNFKIIDQELFSDRIHRTIILKAKDRVIKLRKTLLKKDLLENND